MNQIVVITSKFNVMTGTRNITYAANENDRVTRDWIINRMNIFMKFTAKSLIGQSNQNFVAIYAYADSTENYIKEALNMHEKLPDNIRFVKLSEYMNTLDSIVEGFDRLLLTRLDSDDLYKYDFVERLMNYEIKEGLEEILCQYGYIYDSVNVGLAEYYHKQFTFYTFIYNLSKEENKYSSLNITPLELLLDFSHFRTLDYNYEVLEGRNFIFLIHSSNTNSKFEDYNYGFNRVERHIEDETEIRDILFDFI